MVTIEHATLADLKSIQNLNHQLCIKEANEFDPTINADFPITPAGEKYFKERISGKDSVAFLAKESDKIVGYMIGAIVDADDYRNIKNIAEAENMFVLKDYRGKGIGSQLLKAFFEWSKSKGATIIRTVTSAGNKQSLEFHKANGFKEYDFVLEKEL